MFGTISFGLLVFIVGAIYIFIAKAASLEAAENMCKDKHSVYSYEHLRRSDRQDMCCWRCFFVGCLLLPIPIFLLVGWLS